jgi:starch phosphorylase
LAALSVLLQLTPNSQNPIPPLPPNKTKVIYLSGPSAPGLQTKLKQVFRDLGVDVKRHDANGAPDGSALDDAYYVKGPKGKLSDAELQKACAALEGIVKAQAAAARSGVRPKFQTQTIAPDPAKREVLYAIMDKYKENDVLTIQQDIASHVEYTLARTRQDFGNFECYQATSYSLRDRLIELWNDTQTYFKEQDPKRVYYLSMEFLMGRSLMNTLYNLGIKEEYDEALREIGYNLEKVADEERDAALGNGGLGRLAACFLDSMATLNLPAWGYGIRYTYGMFRQTLINGFQHEQPDYWLTFGNPWEIERLVVKYPVSFYGHVSSAQEEGRQVFKWNAGEQVSAVAYDNPVPGFATRNCINLRLWAAKPSTEFDLQAFNTGDYVQAILSKQRAETLSSVLYPDDRTYEGKELRLKQQHFFVSATVQDVVRRYRDAHPDSWEEFPDKVQGVIRGVICD